MSIESLQKHLRHKVTKGQLAQAIQTLQNLGFISVEENGNIKSLKPHDIFTGFDAPSQAVRSHHKQMMERAKESLDEISVLDREILSLTFGFNPQHLTKVKEEIRAFRDKIDRKYGDDKSSSIFQLNVQFFGHTEN